MIDTVLLRYTAHNLPPTKFLQKFKWRGERYSYYDSTTIYSPRFFCYPSRDGNYYLAAEASLPKLYCGNNIKILTTQEIDLALDILSNLASDVFGVFFNAAKAKVGRIDYCSNFEVGSDKTHAYLAAATNASPKYLKRRIIGKIETVEFYNTHRKIYLYDKERQINALLSKNATKDKETEDILKTAAAGLIRLESRFSNPTAVERLLVEKFQLSDRTAQTLLNENVARQILSEALAQFELNKPIRTFVENLDRLRSFCRTASQFQRIIGFVQLCRYYGQDNLVRLQLVNRSTFYECIADLRNSDCLVYTALETSLPALSVR